MNDNAGNVGVTERAGEKEYVHVSVENPPIVIVFTPEQAEEVHAFIRAQLGEEGASVRILYGGSVKSGNAYELFQQPNIDGG